MACSRGGRVELLARRKENIASDPAANSVAQIAWVGLTVRRRVSNLWGAAADMGAGSDEIRLITPIGSRPTAGKVGHIVRAVSRLIAFRAAIITTKGPYIFCRADSDHVLRCTGRTNR